ncbi:mechanosensitive ion channel family protein [Cellvibrio fontiphilus]|uniref:Mechanosensitive ion channel family protein n=1 Tax=Cellvibrio fontiphilus TaxID=1815559 RepID=A0ABV7FAU1_9GAMM
MDFIDKLFAGFGMADTSWGGSVKIFSLVFLTFLVSFIVAKIFDQLQKHFTRTNNLWDDTLLWAARKPISMMIWIGGLSLSAAMADKVADTEFYSFAEPVARLGLIVMIAWFIVRLIGGAERIVVSPEKMKEPMDPTTVSAMSKLLRGSVLVTATLVILQSMGYSISGVLAFGGIGGIAIGFAAKDLLANFFGGLMIYLDRPFSVGDWVRSPDKEIEGTVEKIGWRLTTIRTFDKRPLYVPNGTFATISLENPSRMSHRRIHEVIGIRYEDAHLMDAIVAEVKQMLIADDEIDTEQTTIVNFNKFNASSLDFFIYAFTKTTNWIHYHQVKQQVLLKVYDIISKQGAAIALPTQTLHHSALSPMEVRPADQQAGN